VILTRASSILRFWTIGPAPYRGTVVLLFAFPPAIRDLHEQYGGAPEQHVGEQNRFIARNRVELGGIVAESPIALVRLACPDFRCPPKLRFPLILSMIDALRRKTLGFFGGALPFLRSAPHS